MALGLQRSEDISTIIARVRRAMPRNMDVMAICDSHETLARGADRPRREPRDPERVRELTRLRVKRFREKQRKLGGK